jgi:hypothetical protein
VRFTLSLPRLLLLVLAAGLLGCVRDPTVQFNHAELNGIQLAAFPPRLAVSLTIVAEVTNPNSFDIGIRGMRGQVFMADRYPLALDFRPVLPPGVPPDSGLWLRAGQVTPVRMPVDMPVDLAVELLRESFAYPVIGFHVVGTADVTGSSSLKINKNNFPVDLRGTVTRQQIQGVVPAPFLPR